MVVIGAGYLGKRISDYFNCLLVSKDQVDATDLSQVKKLFDLEKPQIVINAIGKTGGPGAIGVDWCENHKEETTQSNIVAAINICTEAAIRGIYFIHLGSGCIYEGDNAGKGFSEEDKPNFEGQFYSKTKSEAERILKHFPGLILRIRMPIDNISNPRNLIDKLKGYPRVIDIQNSMTTIPDMLVTMEQMIKMRIEGVYNFVNPGTISAAEIMKMYQEIVDPNHNFEIITGQDLEKIVKARRSNCMLDSTKLSRLGISMPGIRIAVEKCLRDYRSKIN